MGLSNSANNVGRAIAPIWAGFVFDVNVNFSYLSGAVILFVGFLVSVRWLDRSHREGKEVPPDGFEPSSAA